MPAWVAPAVALGAQAIGGLLKKKKQAPNPYAGQMKLWDAAIQRAGTRGEEIGNEYLARLRGFDPMRYARQASEAQYNIAMPQIRRAVGELRGAQVGQGRLNTGFGMADQDRLLTENLSNLNQSLIARAMQAAEMQRATTSELGGYGQAQQNLFLEGALGRYMTEEDRRAAEAASRRGMWGGLLGAGIGAAGQIYSAHRYGRGH